MSQNTRRLSFCAVITALCVVILYISSVLPTMRMALAALAGLLPAAIILRYGIPWGFITYIACALLALILLPNKESAVLYAVIFGHYPVLKALIEKVKILPLEWIFKLAVFNAVFFTVYFLFFTLFTGYYEDFPLGLPVFLILANIVFIIYDLGFSKLIYFYIQRIERNIK